MPWKASSLIFGNGRGAIFLPELAMVIARTHWRPQFDALETAIIASSLENMALVILTTTNHFQSCRTESPLHVFTRFRLVLFISARAGVLKGGESSGCGGPPSRADQFIIPMITFLPRAGG
jgi:hypothetical protein